MGAGSSERQNASIIGISAPCPHLWGRGWGWGLASPTLANPTLANPALANPTEHFRRHVLRVPVVGAGSDCWPLVGASPCETRRFLTLVSLQSDGRPPFPRIPPKGVSCIEWVVNCSPTPGFVRAEQDHLEQMFANVASHVREVREVRQVTGCHWLNGLASGETERLQPRSICPSAWRAKRSCAGPCTGPLLGQGHPPKRVRWKSAKAC